MTKELYCYDCKRPANTECVEQKHRMNTEEVECVNKISDMQLRVLNALNSFRPLADDKPAWRTTRLFDPRTVRSLIRRGLVEPSSKMEWQIKYNLDDLQIRILPRGEMALEAATKESKRP